MYTIDLLKGQQLPKKLSLMGAIAVLAAYAIPAFMLIMMCSVYVNSKNTIAENEKTLGEIQRKNVELKTDVEAADVFVAANKQMDASLAELDDVVAWQMQWSDLLSMIARKMPQSLVVEQMNVKVRGQSITVPKRNDPTKKISITKPSRTLTMQLYGFANQKSDMDIRDFQKDLIGQTDLPGMLKDVVIVLREPDVLKGRDIIRYQIDLNFKESRL
jgi:hypothetical protein